MTPPLGPPVHQSETGGTRPRRRKARLVLTRIDPWSVTRTAFILSLSVAIVIVVAVLLLWVFLRAAGLFDAVGGTVSDLLGGSSSVVSIDALLSFPRVLGFSLLVAAIEVVLLTLLTTLFAFIYNLTVGLAGGVEVTLAEDPAPVRPTPAEPQA